MFFCGLAERSAQIDLFFGYKARLLGYLTGFCDFLAVYHRLGGQLASDHAFSAIVHQEVRFACAIPHGLPSNSIGNRRTDSARMSLSIVQGIVQQHQGTITVDSSLGRGTCFTVSLPLIGDWIWASLPGLKPLREKEDVGKGVIRELLKSVSQVAKQEFQSLETHLLICKLFCLNVFFDTWFLL